MLNKQLGEPVQEVAEAQLEGGAPVHHQHDHDDPPQGPSEQLVNRNPNIMISTQGHGRLYLSSDQLGHVTIFSTLVVSFKVF